MRMLVPQVQRYLRSFSGASDGAVLVEMTILLPFLLVLCAGVFEFGSLFYQKMLVETGVRDAARYMSRCTLAECSETKAKNIAIYGDPAGGTARVDNWAVGDVSITYSSFTNNDGSGNKLYRGGPTIQVVRVATTYSYTGGGLLGFLQNLGIVASPIDINVAHEQRVIGW
jgi:Flp pilus assembly protein TadG